MKWPTQKPIRNVPSLERYTGKAAPGPNHTGYAGMAGALECPQCHWCYAPEDIEAHIRHCCTVKPYMWRGTLNGV